MKTIKAYLQLVRIGNLLMIALGLSLFYYLIIIPVHQDKLVSSMVPFTRVQFLLFVLSVMMVAAAGNVINDYLDFEEDKEYKPERPLANGTISLNTAVYLHAFFAMEGSALGFYLGWVCHYPHAGYIYVMCVILLYLYSSMLKKIPLLGNIVVAALTGFIFALLLLFEVSFLNELNFEAGSYALQVILAQVKFYGTFAFLISLAREIVKDIEDYDGDKAYGITTLPVKFGTGTAKVTVSFVLILLLGGIGWMMKLFGEVGAYKQLAYMFIAIAIPVAILLVYLLVSKNERQYNRASIALKVIMVLGILSIPAFYLFAKV